MVATSADTAKVGAPARSPRTVALVVATVLAVAVLVLTLRLVFGKWVSFSDWAVIELRTSDVGTSSTPLVGPYSRYGWNHPGPLLFYVLAPPYRALGGEGTGILLGALLVNTASLAVIGVVLWRRGQAFGLVVGSAVVLLLVRALGTAFLVDPWNPYVIVVPMLAVVLLAWAATDGDERWALPAAVGLGSFAVQSHVGAAAAVVAAITVALVWLTVDAHRQRAWRPFYRAVLVSLVVGFVCWIPAIVQQFQRDGGNLRDLARFWTDSHDNVTGWAQGAKLTVAQLAIPAPWFTGNEPRDAFTGGVYPGWHVPIALVLLVAACVVAVRRADRSSLRLCSLALALVAVAFVATSRIVDEPFYYVTRWLWIVGAVTWLAIAWTFVRALAAESTAHRVVSAVAGVVVGVLAITMIVGSARDGFPNPTNDEHVTAALAPAARERLRALPEPVLITSEPDLRSKTFASSVLMIARHAGVDARQLPELAGAIGRTHTVREDNAASRVVVAVDSAGDAYRNDPRYRLLARYDPLTPAERAERDALLFDALVAYSEGRAEEWNDSADNARLEDLKARGSRVEIFEELR